MQRKINLYATQRLVELFSNIEHQISYTLNEAIRYRNSFPVSYLDFGSTNDTISFLTRNKYDDIQKSNPNEWNSLVWKDKRSEMKIGKLIKMFYQDSFPINHPKGQPRPKPMIDIESFVNKFKAEKDKDINYDRFEIISGKNFHYWYNQNNYSRFVHEETTLGRSCLRYDESHDYLKMYSTNPDTFSMLILKDDSNRLRGRANIWQLEEPKGRVYMDRVYSVNDYDVELFKDYAKQQGWLYKEAQTYGWHNNIVDSVNGEIHKWDQMTLLSKIKKLPGNHYKYYPYLDTLCVYNPDTKTLTNDGRLRVLEPHQLLTDYQGSYNSEVDGRERVFSTVYNEYIVRDESKFVEIDDTWVYESDAVYVHNSNGKSAFRNSTKIVESYIYKRKFFLEDDTEFSDYLGTFIHKESVRIAYIDTDKKEEVKIHYRMIGREFEEKDGVILKKKIKQNHNPFSKSSIKDKQSYEKMLRHFSGGYSSQNISGENDVSESNEEDNDPFRDIDLNQYSDEIRENIYQVLSEQRNNRIRNGDSFFDLVDFSDTPTQQMGRPVVDDVPEPRERVTPTQQMGRPVIDDAPEPRLRFTASQHISESFGEIPPDVSINDESRLDDVEDNDESRPDDVEDNEGTVSENNSSNETSSGRVTLRDYNNLYNVGSPRNRRIYNNFERSRADIDYFHEVMTRYSGIPSSRLGNTGSTDNNEDTSSNEE